MTGLHVAVAILLCSCSDASRTGSGRRVSTLFKKKAMKRSLTLGAAPSSAPASAPEASPMAAPAGGPAGPCECNFQDMCTCESALAHLDCISKTCASDECDCPEVQFSQSCGQIASVCKPMLEISCTPKQALCDGKFYQLSSSLTGLSIDLEKLDRDAHCGASGKCTGKLEVEAVIHNFEKGMQMECFLEEFPGSKGKTHCSSTPDRDVANCTLPMPKQLPPGDKLEGWCRLVDPPKKDNETFSERLTHDAPFYIFNHHKAIEPPKKFAEAPPPKTPPAKSSAFGAQGIITLLIMTVAALHL